ncbi:hypothetical protein WJN01_14440 [Flavobacteriaceae bacterium SZ-1-7]|uniref:hypothetical protein n=1 Tax=Tamlana sedimenti TaxID=3134126 RepID=UPI00312296C1
MAPEYVAYKLNITVDSVFNSSSEEENKLWKMMENKAYMSGKSLELNCVNTKSRKPNVILSKMDKESLLIQVTTKRVGKQGASGRIYLFFFKDGEIDKVVSESWIN